MRAVYPRLSSRETEVGVRQACGYIGIELDAAQVRTPGLTLLEHGQTRAPLTGLLSTPWHQHSSSTACSAFASRVKRPYTRRRRR